MVQAYRRRSVILASRLEPAMITAVSSTINGGAPQISVASMFPLLRGSVSSWFGSARHNVELAIRRKEGPLVVDGVRHARPAQADHARRVLAERALSDASLLRQYLPNALCGWCSERITPDQSAQVIHGQLYHDGQDLGCARRFEEEAAAYVREYLATHGDAA